MTTWILKTEDDPEPLTFRLTPGAIKTAGRATRADFIVERPLVSRLHCRITAADDALTIEDLESTNGTFVNGSRVSRAEAKSGDLLRLGRVEFSISRQA
jgi:pSer/pThr/pTyr-binding forkhead associated (FHA) protein